MTTTTLASLASFDLHRLAHDLSARGKVEGSCAGFLATMFRHSRLTVIQTQFISENDLSFSDPDAQLLIELDEKRQQIDDEIQQFREKKEQEFRDFENELRAARRRKQNEELKRKESYLSEANGKSSKFKRSSSSSALDLLVGHGISKPRPVNGTSPGSLGTKPAPNGRVSSNQIPTSSKATLSIEPLNIQGDIPQPQQLADPPTPTRLSHALNSSNNHTSSTSASPPHRPPPTPPIKHAELQRIESDASARPIQPMYLPLLDSNNHQRSPSATDDMNVLRPLHHVAIQRSFNEVSLPNGIIPLQSSSFPPSVIVLSPTNPANKRSYTAPTVSIPRIPSALRTASGDNLGRKRKRVTFRLADSAIVEPSSSYEEGPSPQTDESASNSSSRSSSSMSRRRTIGAVMSSDQEDEEAGVKPGMNMGEVMQKLNEYNLVTAGEEGIAGSDDEDTAHFDVKYHEDEDDDDEDLPMSNPTLDTNSADDVDTEEEDGYFSPRAKHAASPFADLDPQQASSPVREQRRGSSPISPHRAPDWDKLSSSDKDRLLFSRRASDEEEASRKSRLSNNSNRPNGVSVTADREQSRSAHKSSSLKGVPEGLVVQQAMKPAVDGGSGVGFFELDEELESPDAGKIQRFEFPDLGDASQTSLDDAEREDNKEEDEEPEVGLDTFDKFSKSEQSVLEMGFGKSNPVGLGGLKRTSSERRLHSGNSSWKVGQADSQMPVGSVPIDIVRPSVSVSSSWIGTFGH